MAENPLRVAVVGGGLAGPCLAHGLLRAGADVTLYERDPGVSTRTQGYRIHVGPEGTAALRECLPPEPYELITATSGMPGSAVTVLGPKLETLNRIAFDDPDAQGHLTVDRETLRGIQLTALGKRVRYGAEFLSYEELPDGRVRVEFDGHPAVEADLLVGADGAMSRVRRRALPDAVVVDTGLMSIFGKTMLTEEAVACTPQAALDGFATVVAGDGRWVSLAAHRYREDPRTAADRLLPAYRPADTRDYVMWVLGVHRDALGGADASALDGAGLRALVADRVGDLHPDVAALVRLGDPATVGMVPIRTAEPITPWRPGPVTLIGDAVHCMIPAGNSVGTGLRDAGLLSRRLGGVVRGEEALRDAVGAYEAEMREYGFAAVAESMRTIESIRS